MKASPQARERMSRAARSNGLTRKQEAFVKAYAKLGNGTRAARIAGYVDKPEQLAVQAHDNLRKPKVIAAVRQEIDRLERIEDYSANRVKRRLDKLSHGAEGVEQYAVAVRAEELIGKAAGMFVDQSLSITANITGDHLQALLTVAKQRQLQPPDLEQDKAVRASLLDEPTNGTR